MLMDAVIDYVYVCVGLAVLNDAYGAQRQTRLIGISQDGDALSHQLLYRACVS